MIGLLFLRSGHFLNLHQQIQTLTPTPTGQLPAGCTQDKVTRIGASGYDGNTVPQNVLDNNFNTRWSNYGSGSYIQIELEKNDILCAVDIAWHRGDVRVNQFSISTSQDGTTFTPLITDQSTKKLIHTNVISFKTLI